MNKVILIGRLTKDPELNFAAGSGTAVTRFSLAVTRPFKKDETDFINCIAFGKPAEAISKYLTKGKQLAVTGNIRTGSYEAKDGTKRYTTDIIIESFEFVGDKGSKGNDNGNTNANSTPSQNGGIPEDDLTPVEDDDLPF